MWFAAGAWGQVPDVWKVCLPDYEVPPYLFKPGESEGALQRLVQDSAHQAGLKVSVLRLPPVRCDGMLERGEIHAVIAGASPENLKIFAFPPKAGGGIESGKRLLQLRMILIKLRQQKWGWNGIGFTQSSGQSLLIGTRSSNLVARDSLERLGAKIDPVAYSPEQLLAKVVAGRVDGAVMLEDEFKPLRDTPNASLVEVLPPPFSVVDYYLVFRKDSAPSVQSLQGAWWSAIGAMRSSPPYQVP
jgi:hypothetical protein